MFEHKVKLLDGSNGYIDLFWKGYILIEMKSPGKDRKKAFEQAKAYANALQNADMPKGILICDFVHFDYYHLEKNAELTSFTIDELADYIELFLFLAGYKDVEYKKQDAVNTLRVSRWLIPRRLYRAMRLRLIGRPSYQNITFRIFSAIRRF